MELTLCRIQDSAQVSGIALVTSGYRPPMARRAGKCRRAKPAVISRRMPVYKRLLPYLRPHYWRMVITIVANLVAALLDGFAIALLIPFLNILFHQPATAIPKWLNRSFAIFFSVPCA